MGSQRVRHDQATEQQQQQVYVTDYYPNRIKSNFVN